MSLPGTEQRRRRREKQRTKWEETTPAPAEAAKNIKSAAEQMKNNSKEGDDNLTDWYEITEKIKKFNDILNEVGGSL